MEACAAQTFVYYLRTTAAPSQNSNPSFYVEVKTRFGKLLPPRQPEGFSDFTEKMQTSN